ncbi:MAG: hypothetical protein AB1430_02690 [Pseudomonadota bacterium]
MLDLALHRAQRLLQIERPHFPYFQEAADELRRPAASGEPRFRRYTSAPVLWTIEQQLAGCIATYLRCMPIEADAEVIDEFHDGQSQATRHGRLDGRRLWALSEYVGALIHDVAHPYTAHGDTDLSDRPTPRRLRAAKRQRAEIAHPESRARRARALAWRLGYSGMPAVNAICAGLPADRRAKFREDAMCFIEQVAHISAKLATLMKDQAQVRADWQEFGIAAPDILRDTHIELAEWLCLAARSLPSDLEPVSVLRQAAEDGLPQLRQLRRQIFSMLGWRLLTVEGLHGGKRRSDVFRWIQHHGGATQAAMAHLFTKDSERAV